MNRLQVSEWLAWGRLAGSVLVLHLVVTRESLGLPSFGLGCLSQPGREGNVDPPRPGVGMGEVRDPRAIRARGGEQIPGTGPVLGADDRFWSSAKRNCRAARPTRKFNILN